MTETTKQRFIRLADLAGKGDAAALKELTESADEYLKETTDITGLLGAASTAADGKDRCSICFYFLQNTPTQGLCREDIAKPLLVPQFKPDHVKKRDYQVIGYQVISFFPTMLNEGWCGKFEPATPTPPPTEDKVA